MSTIFVFAGRESRKRFGLELFREGTADKLVLSVGRFEWRRFEALGLPGDGGLVNLVESVVPRKRHFFVHVDRQSIRAEAVPVGRLGTWSEARALAALVERERLESLLLVSHRRHLRRCRLSAWALLPPGTRLEAFPCPESAGEPSESLLDEAVKLPFYTVLAGVFWALRRLYPPACAGSRFLV
jgi:hypothetical protein